MTHYAPVLWLGGGVRFETLEVIEASLRQAAENQIEGPVKRELINTANAAAAELTKRPKPVCDLL
jgi:hypothetical protein